LASSKAIALLTSLLLLVLSDIAFADSYRAPVTRKGHNLYQIEGKELMVVTVGCTLQAYSEDVLLEVSATGGVMTFLYNKDKCDMKGIYAPLPPSPGRYGVTVTLKAENWYEIFGANTYLKTRDCKTMVLAEEASLLLPSTGLGQIIFKDGRNCAAEAIFAKKRL
jgi:hypothetical protein